MSIIDRFRLDEKTAFASGPKDGIGQLTMALSNERSGHGVQVNAIVSECIATDNTAALRAGEDHSDAIPARIPNACWGRSDELKGSAVFLASPASYYVTGTILPWDGGWLGRRSCDRAVAC